LPVSISLLITSEESVAIGLLVDTTSTECHVVPVSSVPEEVRAPGIVALPAASVIRAGVQAVAIAIFVSTRAISVAAVVFRRVNDGVIVDAEPMTIATPMSVAVTISIPISIPVAVTISISVAVAITVRLRIARDWAIAFSIFVNAAATITVSLRVAHYWAIALSFFVDATTAIGVVVAIWVTRAVATT
jgi:hypothetical protein